MKSLQYQAHDEGDTQRLGKALAEVLPDGIVVALVGTLGAGKTRLVQAVAAASGVASKTVVSPTFVLLGQYQGNRSINHFDAYRLRDEEEFWELGPDDYFQETGLTFVEWADRVEACLPASRLVIRIAITGPESRHFDIDSPAGEHAKVLEQLKEVLGEQKTEDRRVKSEE